MSVALVDDREIRRVNREFLNIDAPTDVISFLYDKEALSHRRERKSPQQKGWDFAGDCGEAGPFGELVISVETAVREARSRGIPPQVELEHYAIHGLLHLLGYDDKTPSARRRMHQLERGYLKRFSPRRKSG